MRTLALWVLLVVFFVQRDLRSQPVVKTPIKGSLQERWSWAKDEVSTSGYADGVWVGYTIQRLMGEDSWIGSFNRFEDEDRPTLHELVTGQRIEYWDENAPGEDLRTSAQRVLRKMDGEKKPERMVVKELAFLLRFDGKGLRASDLQTVRTSNMKLHVDLEKKTLLWLGSASLSESIALLKPYYADATSEKVKEKVVGMIGLHGKDPEVFAFLKSVVADDAAEGPKKDAIFWIGQQDSEEALDMLVSMVPRESSKKMLEQAIFAISQVSLERSTDELIAIGKTSKNLEARKKAMFWLGQKASRRAMETLKDAVYSDEQEEVQKQALFALTQVKDGGVDEVIRVAKTHSNPRVRKQAIFWLGQSDDPRAFDVIVEIAKGKTE